MQPALLHCSTMSGLLRTTAFILARAIVVVAFLVAVVLGAPLAWLVYFWWSQPYFGEGDVHALHGLGVAWGVAVVAGVLAYLADRRLRPAVTQPPRRSSPSTLKWSGRLGWPVTAAMLAMASTPGSLAAKFGAAAAAAILCLLHLHLMIAWHELGHFLAARWMGLPVLEFRVGTGRVVWRRGDAADHPVAWSFWPVLGYVRFGDGGDLIRRAVAIAGGPAASALLTAIYVIAWRALPIAPPGTVLSFLNHFAPVCFASSFIVLLNCLVPATMEVEAMKFESDGRLLLNLASAWRAQRTAAANA